MDMSNSNNIEPSNEINPTISLELGDIIEIVAPTNVALHENSMYIKYIDNQHIQLIHIASLAETQINLDETGNLTDESIIQINLLSRSENKGYARQNNLQPRTWVSIHIGGDIPAIITGEIAILEEDMIEIVTYPELKTIYIDFKYQGIPQNIPIDKIIIREKPASLKSAMSLSMLKQGLEEGELFEFPEEGEEEVATIEFTNSGESIISIPENMPQTRNIHDVLRDLYVDADTISFDDDLGEARQLVEVKESEQRYGIDIQVNDLMDELLSTIPNSERTEMVMNNIHNIIRKYKLLRETYSKFDDNQNIYDFKKHGDFYKPLVQNIMKMNVRLQWLLPIVKVQRKLYDIHNGSDIADIFSDTTASTLTDIQTIQDNYYERNVNDTKDYALMQKRIQEIMNPINVDKQDDSIYTTQILADIDAIVDNLDDFNSTVYTRSGASKRQYVMQRYNLGLSKLSNQLLKGGKTVYTRTDMTPNETICLKSLMVLPAPVIKFSAIHLPTTNMLNRVSLHQQYFSLFRALRKNTEIIPHIIDDLDKELDYEKIESETKQTIFNGIHEFMLGDIDHIDNAERFQKFVESIIPQTYTIIQLFHKYMKNKLSMISVVQQLEPFMIYTEDITYSQYKAIFYFVNKEIKTLKSHIGQNILQFNKMHNYNYNVINKPNIILRLLAEKKDIADSFFQVYKLIHPGADKQPDLSPHELLDRMIKMDTGTVFMNAITSIMSSLITPTNIIQSLNDQDIGNMDDVDKIKPADCMTRVLSKKYTSIKDLQKDNQVDFVYVDKEFDDTPYDIIDKYKDEQTNLEPDLFVDFLVENLIQRHNCPSYMAPELAKIIIAKKKEVVTGNYAILEIKPTLKEGFDESKMNEEEKESVKLEADVRKKIQYYRRLKDTWVVDTDVTQTTFMDTQSLYCNISARCLYNDKSRICESSDNAKIRINTNTKDELKTEFNKRYIQSVEEFETQLETKIAYYIKQLKRNIMLREVRESKQNNLAFEIGKRTTTIDGLTSAHVDLRELIMGQPDFIKKQTDICKFVAQYTREPMIEQLNESPYWFYCKDTNTKLFPKAIFNLANTFVSGGDYQNKQAEICTNVGVMSDAGDSIVDKHSGYIIRKLDFSDEDGFDEAGFRMTSHALIEKDLGDASINAGKSLDRIFDNETSEQIYNIANTLLTRINIPVSIVESFILRVSNEVIDKHLLNETAYGRRNDAMIKKTGKPLSPYDKYKNETIIMIVSAVTFVSIQSATPSFVVNRVFPGCIKSFTGYPLTGIEDISGIQYMACIVNKVKSSIQPWDSIQKLNPDKITSRIKDLLANYIVKRSDIDELYTIKRLFLTLNPDNEIPKEHAISKWHHFMPPVTPYTVIKSLRPINGDFKTELLETIKNGNSNQNNMISLLHSRISAFGYGIIELINTIVKDKELLLQTSSQIPFLENACCNDGGVDLIKPILYFNEQDNNIKVLLQKVRSMINFQHTIRNMSTCSSLFHNESTRLLHPDLPTGRLEENIYAAIIFYCNFDKKLPIPNDLIDICDEKLPDYKSSWSMLDKMEFMKRNGKQYTIETLYTLMTIINNRNRVEINLTPTVNIVDGLTDFIEHLDVVDSTLFGERLREHLRNVINQYNPNKMHDVFTQELTDLTDYLSVCNQHMFTKIMEFFDSYGNLPNREYEQLRKFLSGISTWTIDTPNHKENIYDNGLYTVTQYLQNAIVMISKVYPELLLNNATPYMVIPKHWGLAEDHVFDIEKFLHKYHRNIESFSDDQTLGNILQQIVYQTADMNGFLKLIPLQTDIQREIINESGEKQILSFYSVFGKETIYLLFTHCFYLLLCNYINLSDEPNIIRTDKQLSKTRNREHQTELNDSALHLGAISQTTDDIDDISEIQIYTDTQNIDLKTRTASLLYAFLQIEMSNKKETNYTYDDVRKKVNMAKEREKKSFVDYLGVDNMTDESRKAEVLMKKYRLGRWNIGQQRGLVHYDKDTYTRERNEMLAQLNEDVAGNVHEVVNDMRREIYDIEQDDNMATTHQSDIEANDISGLGDDYGDGAFYAEDREPEND